VENQANPYYSQSLSVLFANPGGKTRQSAPAVTCSANNVQKKGLLRVRENVRIVHEHLLPLMSFLST